MNPFHELAGEYWRREVPASEWIGLASANGVGKIAALDLRRELERVKALVSVAAKIGNTHPRLRRAKAAARGTAGQSDDYHALRDSHEMAAPGAARVHAGNRDAIRGSQRGRRSPGTVEPRRRCDGR